MHKVTPITSLQNPKVKQLIKLRDKRAREKDALCLIEGYREILRAKEAGYPIESLFFCESLFLGVHERELISHVGRHAHLYQVPESVFQKCSYRDRPDGLLAIAPLYRRDQDTFIKQIKEKAQNQPLFLLIAESIEKPGNLGSILRSCDAAGVHGVLVCDPQTDVFNPNVIRASIGVLFSMPLLECPLQEALQLLKDLDIHLVAATPHAKRFFTEENLTQSVAIAMGTEQLGLSKEVMDRADVQVKIPMLGIADSLNVAAATTLMLYEVVRQRGL
jgi:TrmH family RNA methyltransferase